jgi:hypothetical protein
MSGFTNISHSKANLDRRGKSIDCSLRVRTLLVLQKSTCTPCDSPPLVAPQTGSRGACWVKAGERGVTQEPAWHQLLLQGQHCTHCQATAVAAAAAAAAAGEALHSGATAAAGYCQHGGTQPSTAVRASAAAGATSNTHIHIHVQAHTAQKDAHRPSVAAAKTTQPNAHNPPPTTGTLAQSLGNC